MIPPAPTTAPDDASEHPPSPPAPRRVNTRRLLWIAGGIVVSGLACVAVVVCAILWWGRGAADIDPERLLHYQPTQVTRVLARDGTVIGELHTGERRTVVAYDQLPTTLVDAFLAAEDADFFTHDGLDWPGIARAVWVNLSQTEAKQGASTITQQVIKNTLLPRSRSVQRKSQELLLARRVEATLSKRQIFEIYVNEIYFGEGRYGVVEAARFCFAKTLDELDLGEMATLAALPNAPGIITCDRRVERLEARRDYVLEQMVEHHFVGPETIAPYLGRPLAGRAPGRLAPSPAIGEADEFVELAHRELIRRYGVADVARLGATVWTTVDLDVQRAARAAGRRELDELEARHGYGTHARPLSTQARARLAARDPASLSFAPGVAITVTLVDQAPTVRTGVAGAERLQAMAAGVPVEIELGPLATLAPDELAARFPPGHAIEVRIVTPPSLDRPALARFGPGPELALALVAVESADLLALLGGREFVRGQFDRARLARRQPASSFKPVVYAAALRSGSFDPDSTLPGSEGAAISLTDALAQSDNVVPPALLSAIGPTAVHQLARDLGVTSELGSQPSLALGTSELTPIELLTAYLTIARVGEGQTPRVISAIEVPPDLRGDRVVAANPELVPERFGIAPELAVTLTTMLVRVVEVGTGQAARALGRPVAAKTGTSDGARDAWFVGFTADHVAVSWVGFDQPVSLGRNESGSSLAVAPWLAAMAAASEATPVRPLPVRTVPATPRRSGEPRGPATR